ncbi:MAG: HAD-IIIA family hydrolase [Legionellaceae bacterium]|nr:HAD-IIIA family hydrolase [Legionellaceae bacterium]
MKELEAKAKKVRCLICDVDGVLTNAHITIDTNGVESKSFNIQDGLGLKLLLRANIEVAIITGSTHTIIDHRMKQLNITNYFKGKTNKQDSYDQLKARLNLQDDQFAYIGDDLPDIAIMKQVGFSIAIANAVKEVKQVADWNTELKGGNGGVREVCDFILNSQNMAEIALERHLNQ